MMATCYFVWQPCRYPLSLLQNEVASSHIKAKKSVWGITTFAACNCHQQQDCILNTDNNLIKYKGINFLILGLSSIVSPTPRTHTACLARRLPFFPLPPKLLCPILASLQMYPVLLITIWLFLLKVVLVAMTFQTPSRTHLTRLLEWDHQHASTLWRHNQPILLVRYYGIRTRLVSGDIP